MLESIINYFQQDLLRILYVIGGGGGIWFWFDKWRFRTRIKVRLLSERYDSQYDYIMSEIQVECNNLGNLDTSIEPIVKITGINHDRKTKKYTLSIVETNRALKPHDPKTFNFKGKCDHEFLFTRYRHYNFSLSRGFSKSVYFLRSRKTELNLLQFLYGKIRYKMFNKLPEKA